MRKLASVLSLLLLLALDCNGLAFPRSRIVPHKNRVNVGSSSPIPFAKRQQHSQQRSAASTQAAIYANQVRYPLPSWTKQRLPQWTQCLFVLGYYALHCRYELDLISAPLILVLLLLYHVANKLPFPKLFNVDKVPWRRPRQDPAQTFVLIASFFVLYYYSGFLAPCLSSLLDLFCLHVPSLASQRAIIIVTGHLLWIVPCILALTKMDHYFPPSSLFDWSGSSTSPSPSPSTQQQEIAEQVPVQAARRFGRARNVSFWKAESELGSDWWTISKETNWVWWVCFGYSISLLVFRVSDWANLRLMPASWFENESFFAQTLLSQESSDTLALAITATATCFSAPLWEELFYRGLIFPFLASIFPMPVATPLSAIIFAVHHLRKDSFIPLAALGMTWSIIYLKSGNLLTTILLHCMWNFRVQFF